MAALAAFVTTLALAPLVLWLLRRWGVLDNPSERSSHTQPTLRGGGVAPAVGALTALVASSQITGTARLGLLITASGFGLIGLVEDLVGVPVGPRFALQVVVAAGAAPFLLSGMDGGWGLAVLAGAAVVVWAVGYVNAFNFMDGIDGISVAQCVVAGATWVAIGAAADAPLLEAGGAIIAAAALGFSPWSLPRARMFLGDVGSYFLGGWLAAVAVLGLRAGVAPEAVLAPLVLWVADTSSTLVLRFARGDTWYLPHRQHCYQRLTQSGWSHAATTGFVSMFLAACSALGAVSLGDSLVLRVLADVALAAVVVAYLTSPRWLARKRPGVGGDSGSATAAQARMPRSVATPTPPS